MVKTGKHIRQEESIIFDVSEVVRLPESVHELFTVFDVGEVILNSASKYVW